MSALPHTRGDTFDGLPGRRQPKEQQGDEIPPRMGPFDELDVGTRCQRRFEGEILASMATLPGLNGERPLAISSALTNSLHPSISGNTV